MIAATEAMRAPGKTLTRDELKAMRPYEMFATGVLPNEPGGLFMESAISMRGRPLRWVTCRGQTDDWAIYCMWEDEAASLQFVIYHGDKVRDAANVRLCVPCDDEALKRYRY